MKDESHSIVYEFTIWMKAIMIYLPYRTVAIYFWSDLPFLFTIIYDLIFLYPDKLLNYWFLYSTRQNSVRRFDCQTNRLSTNTEYYLHENEDVSLFAFAFRKIDKIGTLWVYLLFFLIYCKSTLISNTFFFVCIRWLVVNTPIISNNLAQSPNQLTTNRKDPKRSNDL